MELVPTEEINRMTAYAEELLERLEREPELADRLIASVEKRVLTEQPAESPKERYERLFFNGSNGGRHK